MGVSIDGDNNWTWREVGREIRDDIQRKGKEREKKENYRKRKERKREVGRKREKERTRESETNG